MASEPASPMKSFAGKLWMRKPTRASARQANRRRRSCFPATVVARRTAAQMRATPAERPSALSRKLKALVMMTIQKVRRSSRTMGIRRRGRSDVEADDDHRGDGIEDVWSMVEILRSSKRPRVARIRPPKDSGEVVGFEATPG